MIRSTHIIKGIVLALLPAIAGVAAPVQSRLDVEQLCYYSLARRSPYAGGLSDPLAESSFNAAPATRFAASSSGRTALHDVPVPQHHDSLTAALEARDYVVDRGRVLMRDYELNFDSSSFHFLPYDADVGLLGLQFVTKTPLFGDSVHAVWADPQPLYFHVTAEQAEELEALRTARALSVNARVQLAAREEPSRPICVRDAQDRPVVELLLLDGTLLATSSQQPLGHAVTDRFDQAACDNLPHDPERHDPVPKVRVTQLSSVGDSSLSDTEGAMLRLLAETELHACYMDALRHNAALRGAVVVEFSLDPSGDVNNAGVVIDAANNAALTRCTISTLDTSAVPREADSAALSVRMNLTFSRR